MVDQAFCTKDKDDHASALTGRRKGRRIVEVLSV
jgi:hypothetical protein